MHARTLPFRNCSRLLRRRAAGWWLLALLVVAPWLGNLHAIVHPAPPPGGWAQPRHAAVEASDARAAIATTVHAPPAPAHGLQRLFGPHDAGDCRVYDQLLHADALVSAFSVVLPAVWAAVLFAAPPQPSPICGSAVFEARAPPPAR